MKSVVVVLSMVVLSLAGIIGSIGTAAPAGAVITSMSVVPTPDPEPAGLNSLNGVSCVSATFCIAVGQHDGATAEETSVVRWDGTAWSTMVSPNTSPTVDNRLYAVSCVSESWCVAAGSTFDGSLSRTLILVWDGSSWTIQTSPNLSASQDYLNGVSCTSATSCLAVGSFQSAITRQTMVLVWDGSTWTSQASANTSTSQYNYLSGVSCSSASACTAVGSYHDGVAYRTLVTRWNGTSWSVQPSPNESANRTNMLSAVSCATATSCTAVGSFDGGTTYRSLVLAWDGATWSQQAAPATPNLSDDLYGVSCTSPSFCIAIGASYDGTDYRTLAVMWDGVEWTVLDSPNSAVAGSNLLMAVSCVSDHSCMSVGVVETVATKLTLAIAMTGPAPEPSTTTTTTAPSTDPAVPTFTG